MTSIRRLIAKYDHQPGYEDKAVDLVLELAELFAAREDPDEGVQ